MERVAIIGSGIAGLGCAHFLHRTHDITIYEAGGHVGGHSNTVDVDENGREVPIDTGFIVYNEVTYPLLTKLFKKLDVPTKPTSMSFSVHHDPSGQEWNGTDMNTIFGQRRNLFSIRFWRFLFKLKRFNAEAVAAIDEPRWAKMTLQEYVDARGYGEDFLERYLVPMSSAVWSTPPEKMLKFPALTLHKFWHNHGFLGLHTRHPWRTVDGGSREYVKRLIAPFQDRIRLNTPVHKIHRHPDHVEVVTGGVEEKAERYDKVIVATHGDQALRLLEIPTPLEQELLSVFQYQDNAVLLHTDDHCMPKTERCWAAWNYRYDEVASSNTDLKPTTHYWMNRLQGVSDHTNYFVSLNTGEEVPATHRKQEFNYDHPLFDLPAREAQSRLPELNTTEAGNRTFFCGSYFRNGFHEDAFRSSVDLCTELLEGDPWPER
jgi:predicted NAD/FAD-binding protein